MTNRILFLDTETGGIDPQINSLLTIGLVIWEDFELKDSIEIYINDGKLNVTEEALDINSINIKEHIKHSVDPNIAFFEFKNFLKKHFDTNEKITLAGHNINFDVNFLKAFLRSNDMDFYELFSHRFIDTASILQYLFLAKKINNKTISSDEAFKIFGIETEKRHSALEDAKATAKLFSNLLQIIQK